MPRPTKNLDGTQVRRSIALPRSVDSGINDVAKKFDETRSGVIIKLYYFFAEHNKALVIKTEPQQKTGTQNGR